MSHARANVPPERQHEIRNEIVDLLCEFYGLPESKGVAAISASQAITSMGMHAWKDWLTKEVERNAGVARSAGHTVEIDRSLPSVCVKLGPDNMFAFQNEEAGNLMSECPEFLNMEEWILWIAKGW